MFFGFSEFQMHPESCLSQSLCKPLSCGKKNCWQAFTLNLSSFFHFFKEISGDLGLWLFSHFIPALFALFFIVYFFCVSCVYRFYNRLYLLKKKFLNHSTRNKQKWGLRISILRKIDTLYLIFDNFTMSSKFVISTIGMQTKTKEGKTNDRNERKCVTV